MQIFSSFSYQLIILFLSFSILLTGCHSYYTIPNEDYSKLDSMENIKIVYTNGKEFVVEKNDTTEAKIVGDSLIVYRGVEKNLIAMNEISKIKENRFDLGGTITIIIIPLIILVAYFFANFSFY
jgi:hypothetical protein